MAFFIQNEAFRKAGLFRKGTTLKALPYQDPTYLGFLLLFQWNDVKTTSDTNATSIPDAIISSPLFDPSGAEAYLKRLAIANKKYENKLTALTAFKTGLQKINLDMPWYWQSMSGLDKLQAYDTNEPYIGKDGNEIAIGCLESINLAITGLMRNYREAVFDEESWSYVLPPNLRKFSVKIYVSDIRPIFNGENSGGKTNAEMTKPNKIGKVSEFNIDPTVADQQTVADVDLDLTGSKKKPYLAFQLTNCEWNIQTGVTSFAELKNDAPEMASQIIAFNYEKLTKVELIAMNGIIDDNMVMSVGAQSPAPIIESPKLSKFEEAKKRATEDMKNLAEKKKQEAITAASSLVKDRTGIPFTMDGMKPKLETEGVYMNLVNKLDNVTNIQRLNTRQVAESFLGNVYFGAGQTIQDVLNNGLQKALGNIYK
jgi:hypothetical protein